MIKASENFKDIIQKFSSVILTSEYNFERNDTD
jgi:hypothetical protein